MITPGTATQVRTNTLVSQAKDGFYLDSKSKTWTALSVGERILRTLFCWVPNVDSIATRCLKLSGEFLANAEVLPLTLETELSKWEESTINELNNPVSSLSAIAGIIAICYAKVVLKQNAKSAKENEQKDETVHQHQQNEQGRGAVAAVPRSSQVAPEARFKELEIQNQQLRAELESKKQECDKVKETTEQFNTQKERLESQLAAAKKAAAAAEERLAQNSQIQAQKEGLERRNQTLEATLDGLEKEKANLTLQLQQHETDLKAAVKSKEDQMSASKLLYTTIAGLQARIKELEDKDQSNERTLQASRESESLSNQRATTASLQAEEKQKTILQHEEEIARLKKERETLQQQLDKAASASQEQQTQAGTAASDKDQLLKQTQALQSQIDTLQSQVRDLNASLEKSSAEKAKVDNAYRAVVDENTRLNQSKLDLEKQLNEVQSENKTSNTNAIEMANNVRSMREECVRMKNNLDEVTKREDALKDQVRAVWDTLQESNNLSKQSAAEMVRWKAAAEEQQKEVKRQKEEIAALSSQNDDLRRVGENALVDVMKLRREKEDALEKVKLAIARESSLQQQLKAQAQLNDTLRSDLATKEAALKALQTSLELAQKTQETQRLANVRTEKTIKDLNQQVTTLTQRLKEQIAHEDSQEGAPQTRDGVSASATAAAAAANDAPLKTEREENSEETETLQSQHAETPGQIRAMKRLIRILKRTNAELLVGVETLTQRCLVFNQQCSDFKCERDRLAEELTTKNQEAKQREGEISRLKQANEALQQELARKEQKASSEASQEGNVKQDQERDQVEGQQANKERENT